MNKKGKVVENAAVLIVAVLACTILIIMAGANPLDAYASFFNGIIGSLHGSTDVFVKATPLILAGLGLAVAFKTGFFNIGAEGQFYMGALAAAAVSLNLGGLPGPLRIIVSMVAGFLCGGLWALVAAVLKAKFRISEIIVTIMLNYIAIDIVGIAVRSFLMDPDGNVPQSAKIASVGLLGKLLPPTQLHTGFLIALAAVFVIWFLMEKTTIGYELKVVGFNKRAASCNGIFVMRNIVISAFLSGGLAGLAGVVEVLGVQKRLLEGISSNCGYTAVLVALMASNRPVLVFAGACGFAAMQVGVNSMQRQMGVPSALVNILMGLVVILVLIKEVFHISKKKKGVEQC